MKSHPNGPTPPTRRRGPLARISLSLTATAVVSCLLTLPSSALEEPGAEEAPAAFSGYSSQAVASPLRVEVFEPTIPVPADPQAEVWVAYSRADTSSGTGKARSSWLWPGDPVGEGAKTFVEALGLPPALGEAGYPVQVNAEHPGGPDREVEEPLPGALMRAQANAEFVAGRVGYSSDHKIDKRDPAVQRNDGSTEDEDSEADGGSGMPGLPVAGRSGSGSQDPLGLLSSVLGGKGAGVGASGSRSAGADDGQEGGLPPIPPGLIDIDGMTSVSRTTTDDRSIDTVARASLGDVALLGGLVELEGISVVSRTVADGQEAAGAGRALVGAIRIAGVEFGFGNKGPVVPGGNPGIPGLPNDPTEALAALGISLKLPKTNKTIAEDNQAAEFITRGLQVTIDLEVLAPVLSQLPLQPVLDAVPFPEDAAALKSALSAIPGLKPRIVLTLGTARSETSTVQGIDFGDLPSIGDPSDLGPGSVAGGGGDPGSGDLGGDLGGGDLGEGDLGGMGDSGDVAGGDAGGDAGTGELTETQPLGAGLPPLNSIPGALMFGGLAAAAAMGMYLRRLGLAALGGIGACAHGLETGIPDLRKA
ncbi:MAG: hypothetical protein Q8Q02_05240 [Nocardioides sp.]|nr:hypothetical protein [Nocardioides sp.]